MAFRRRCDLKEALEQPGAPGLDARASRGPDGGKRVVDLGDGNGCVFGSGWEVGTDLLEKSPAHSNPPLGKHTRQPADDSMNSFDRQLDEQRCQGIALRVLATGVSHGFGDKGDLSKQNQPPKVLWSVRLRVAASSSSLDAGCDEFCSTSATQPSTTSQTAAPASLGSRVAQ